MTWPVQPGEEAEMREMRGDLMAIYMLVIRGSGGTDTDVLSADRTRRNNMKLWQGIFS